MELKIIKLRDRFPAEMFELLDELKSYGAPPFKDDDPLYNREPWPKLGTTGEYGDGWYWWSVPMILEYVTKEEMLQAIAEMKGAQK